MLCSPDTDDISRCSICKRPDDPPQTRPGFVLGSYCCACMRSMEAELDRTRGPEPNAGRRLSRCITALFERAAHTFDAPGRLQ
jgi:hypothetical protein